MAKLEGQKIADSYEQLLHVDRDGGGNTTTLVDVKDGKNTTTFALKLATDKISVVGDDNVSIIIDSTTATRNGILSFTNSADNKNFEIKHNSFDPQAGTNQLEINSTDTADIMVFNLDGKVGVGIPTPSSLLSLNGVAGNTTLGLFAHSSLHLHNTTAVNSYSQITFGYDTGRSNAAAVIGYKNESSTAYGKGALVFATRDSTNDDASTERMRISSDGKLGVGSSPTHAKMEIVGDSDAFQLTMSDVADADDTIKEARMGMLHYKQAEEPVTLFYAQSGSSENAIYIGGGTGVGNHATSVAIATASTYNSTSTTTNMKIDNNSRISLSNNDGGTGNTVFGYNAGNQIASGDNYNVFIGHNVADADMTNATENIGMGYAALSALTEGDSNITIGYGAGETITTSSNNILIGSRSGDAITTGASQTVAIGSNACGSLTTGTSNVAIGYNSLTLLTVGASNTAIGYSGLSEEVGGGNSTSVGNGALGKSNGGSSATLMDNTGVGVNSGFYNVTGTKNTYLGSHAGFGATGESNSDNTGIGYKSLFAITTGTNNVAIGSQAGDAITDGNSNVAVGYLALSSSVSAQSNTAIGRSAMQNTTTAHTNVAIGGETMGGITTATVQDATVVGYAAFKGSSSTTTGANGTTAIGRKALFSLTSGSRNTAIGFGSLDAEDAGSNNTAVGYEALTAQNNDDGANTAVGMRAGLAVTTGYSNTLLGSGAGATLQGGYQNTYVGRDADGANGRINSTAVGFGTTAQADNSVTLGNASVTAVYMAQDSGATVHCAGVNFPDTQVASADANTLDDYEEGSWTPVYEAATNSFTTMTMDIVSATYTKIGRQVTVRGSIRTDNVSVGSASGTLRLGGLPFDSVATHGESVMVIGHTYNWTSNNFPYAAYNLSDTDQVLLVQRDTSNGATASMVVGDLTTGASSDQNGMIFSLTYFTD